MADDVYTDSAQSRIIRTIAEKLGLSQSNATMVYAGTESFAASRIGEFESDADFDNESTRDASFQRIKAKVLRYAGEIALPVLGCLAAGFIAIGAGLGAPIAAVVALVVFFIIWVKRGAGRVQMQEMMAELNAQLDKASGE